MTRRGSLLPKVFRAVSTGAAFCCAAASAPAAEPVRLELVLAVDCSSSVNRDEFTLQMEGIAGAFEDGAVLAALAQIGEAGIAVGLLQWSSAGAQTRSEEHTSETPVTNEH